MEKIINNKSAERFELDINGQVSYAAYRQADGVYTINYVFAPETLRGTGAASELMGGIMDIAKAEGHKVTPVCSYAVAWLRRHPQFQDLVA